MPQARCHELVLGTEAAHEEKRRLSDELSAARAEAASAIHGLEEQLQRALSERRLLQQQLSYIHAMTKPPWAGAADDGASTNGVHNHQAPPPPVTTPSHHHPLHPHFMVAPPPNTLPSSPFSPRDHELWRA